MVYYVCDIKAVAYDIVNLNNFKDLPTINMRIWH